MIAELPRILLLQRNGPCARHALTGDGFSSPKVGEQPPPQDGLLDDTMEGLTIPPELPAEPGRSFISLVTGGGQPPSYHAV